MLQGSRQANELMILFLKQIAQLQLSPATHTVSIFVIVESVAAFICSAVAASGLLTVGVFGDVYNACAMALYCFVAGYYLH